MPAGQGHTLSTHLTRTATNAPIANWIVRYEVVDGTSADVRPDNATSIEVRTDDNGMGNAAAPADEQPGRVSRKCTSKSFGQRIRTVTHRARNWVKATRRSPGVHRGWRLRASGPPTGAVDSTLVYRVEVHNPGDIPTRDVVVQDVLPPNLQFVSSNPPAQMFGNRAQWRLGDLAGQGHAGDRDQRPCRRGRGRPLRIPGVVRRRSAGRCDRRHGDRPAVVATQRHRARRPPRWANAFSSAST